MPDIISGTTLVTSLNQSQLVLDMEGDVTKMYNDAFPFEALTRTIGGLMKADRMKHEWREDRLMGITAIVTANAAVNATSIAVNSPALMRRDMTIYCPATGEQFFADEDVGGTAVAGQIKVRRQGSASGTGIETAIPAGASLLFLTESHYEGQAIPLSYSTVEDARYTYLEQFDRVYDMTDIAKYERKYGQDEWDKQVMKIWIEEKRKLNLKLWTGKGFRETTSSGNGARRHGLSGLFEQCTAREVNMAAVPGGVSVQTLGNLLRPTKTELNLPQPPILLAGQNLWNGISALPSNLIRIMDPGADGITFGVKISTINTPFGEIKISYDPTLSMEYGLADRGAMIQTAYIQQLELTGLPLRMELGKKNPTEAHIYDRALYTGTRGLVVKLPEVHRTIVGVQGN